MSASDSTCVRQRVLSAHTFRYTADEQEGAGACAGACLVCRAVERVDAKEQLAQTRQLRESTEQLRGGHLTRAGAAQVYVPEHVEPGDGRQRVRVLFAV